MEHFLKVAFNDLLADLTKRPICATGLIYDE
jgi:hypothetical protein